jgi:transposase, IS5 family
LQIVKPDKSPIEVDQSDLFRSRLSSILDHRHPLYVLAESIDWERFDREFGLLYSEKMGRPGLATRLMVGLHYVKYLCDVSDERVVEGFIENPYWQYFCGMEYFVHELPCDPTSLVKWRKRIGVAGAEKLLEETIETAKREGGLKTVEVKRVNVDTTVQEKAIAYPTDARLYEKARRRLVKEAKQEGIVLRQSYARLGPRALRMQGQYAHARQVKRARKETKKLKVMLGRVIRDIRRKPEESGKKLSEKLQESLRIAELINQQQKDDKGKIYSMHAPEVECIAKGKVHKKYEFGCKVSVATTSKSNWVVGIDAVHGNPYDGKTLKETHQQVEKLTGQKVEEIFVDKGYKGTAHHPEGVKVYLAGRKLKGILKKLLKRRSAIEPVIGHLKHDHRMERNHLLGKDGDRINAMLVGSGFNLRKLLGVFFCLIFRWLDFDLNREPAPSAPNL